MNNLVLKVIIKLQFFICFFNHLPKAVTNADVHYLCIPSSNNGLI